MAACMGHPRISTNPPAACRGVEILARHYYPPRSELKCHVCDFGEGRAEHKVVDLGELEEFWQTKPAWVDVRWIHAPLGLGLTHSSVEDIFLRMYISKLVFSFLVIKTVFREQQDCSKSQNMFCNSSSCPE